jgi:hypothetical protein
MDLFQRKTGVTANVDSVYQLDSLNIYVLAKHDLHKRTRHELSSARDWSEQRRGKSLPSAALTMMHAGRVDIRNSSYLDLISAEHPDVQKRRRREKTAPVLFDRLLGLCAVLCRINSPNVPEMLTTSIIRAKSGGTTHLWNSRQCLY